MEKLNVKFAAFTCAALILTSCSIKQVEHKAKTITVSGSGQVFVNNDQVKVTFHIEDSNADVITADNMSNEKVETIKAGLRELGVSDSNVTVENLEIELGKTHQEGRFIVPAQYTVSRNVNVALKDMSKISSIIDSVYKSGRGTLVSIKYYANTSSIEEAVKQARILAVKQAEENANLLSGCGGASLGVLIAIEEESETYSPRRELSSSKAIPSYVPMEDKTTSILIKVNATYEIQ